MLKYDRKDKICLIMMALLLAFLLFLLVSPESFASHKKYRPKPVSWMCWASPLPKVLESCRKRGTCSGAGIYAWHDKRSKAASLAYTKCIHEYEGECIIDYCETFSME